MNEVEKVCTVGIDLDTLTRIKSIALKHLTETGEQITHCTVIARALAAYEREELARQIELGKKDK